jgi:exopolysaccharide biosynthesis polyprenyl glycosylphosphotransferase
MKSIEKKAPIATAELKVPRPALPPVPIRVIHYRKRKRGLDTLGSLILITLFSPVLLAIAAIIKLTSPGPVFYVSTRVGRGGRLFGFLKFRSMYVDADRRLAELRGQNEKDGPIFKMKDDPRITPVGRFLRKYSLDELPQLFNVLKGDMSLVGPRPPIPHEVEQYDEYCLERLGVRPGLTCYWQIMGRSNLTFAEWMELDHRYLREMGLWTDLKILLKTPLAVLKGDGAY